MVGNVHSNIRVTRGLLLKRACPPALVPDGLRTPTRPRSHNPTGDTRSRFVVADGTSFVEHPGNAGRPHLASRPIASLLRPSGSSRSYVLASLRALHLDQRLRPGALRTPRALTGPPLTQVTRDRHGTGEPHLPPAEWRRSHRGTSPCRARSVVAAVGKLMATSEQIAMATHNRRSGWIGTSGRSMSGRRSRRRLGNVRRGPCLNRV
jgi:hypothetical protein